MKKRRGRGGTHRERPVIKLLLAIPALAAVIDM
jgi:hypothetical protein